MAKPQRHFELFAVETVRDTETGNVLQCDHAFVVSEKVDGETPRTAQLTFDEWLEDAVFWRHHLESADSFEEEDDNGHW